MKRLHLIFGILLFVAFLITGQFMRADFPDKDAIDQFLRVLMRSRHIYILFSSLIHLALGCYLTMAPRTLARSLQYLGSALLFASSLLLVWAFVSEAYVLHHFSDFSRYGLFTSLAGIGLHVIGAAAEKLKR